MKRKSPHHNNKGARNIQRDKTYKDVKRMARRLGVPARGV